MRETGFGKSADVFRAVLELEEGRATRKRILGSFEAALLAPTPKGDGSFAFAFLPSEAGGVKPVSGTLHPPPPITPGDSGSWLFRLRMFFVPEEADLRKAGEGEESVNGTGVGELSDDWKTAAALRDGDV